MNPYYYGTPRSAMVQATVANTLALSGAGTFASIITGLTNGTEIVGVLVKGTGNSASGKVFLGIYKGSGTTQVIGEMTVSAITVGAATPAFEQPWAMPVPIKLENNWILQAAPYNAETFNIFVRAGDY